MNPRTIVKRASRSPDVREDLTHLGLTGFTMVALVLLRSLFRTGTFWFAAGFMACLIAICLLRFGFDVVRAARRPRGTRVTR